jgi:hypothetical protein
VAFQEGLSSMKLVKYWFSHSEVDVRGINRHADGKETAKIHVRKADHNYRIFRLF